MNNFIKCKKLEDAVRECAINDGIYDSKRDGWVAKMIESDNPDCIVMDYIEIEYKNDKFGTPTPSSRLQKNGIDLCFVLYNQKTKKTEMRLVQEKSLRSIFYYNQNDDRDNEYGYELLFEIVNKNEKRGWGCELGNADYIIFYYRDCSIVVSGLSKIEEFCNELYDIWVNNGSNYDRVSYNCGGLRNQRMFVNKQDGSGKKQWSMNTKLSKWALDKIGVGNIRKINWHYRLNEE